MGRKYIANSVTTTRKSLLSTQLRRAPYSLLMGSLRKFFPFSCGNFGPNFFPDFLLRLLPCIWGGVGVPGMFLMCLHDTVVAETTTQPICFELYRSVSVVDIVLLAARLCSCNWKRIPPRDNVCLWSAWILWYAQASNVLTLIVADSKYLREDQQSSQHEHSWNQPAWVLQEDAKSLSCQPSTIVLGTCAGGLQEGLRGAERTRERERET